MHRNIVCPQCGSRTGGCRCASPHKTEELSPTLCVKCKQANAEASLNYVVEGKVYDLNLLSPVPTVPDGMTAEKLRIIAEKMDLLDNLSREFLRVVAQTSHPLAAQAAVDAEVPPSTVIQTDLRLWAAELERQGR